MRRHAEQVFPRSAGDLYAAIAAYVRGKPEYYSSVVEDPATLGLDAKLMAGFFAYSSRVHFAVTAAPSGSTLVIDIKTHPLFFMDPLDFWGRYCQRVFHNVAELC